MKDMEKLEYTVQAGGCEARLVVYLHDESHFEHPEKRKFMLIFPGGGYAMNWLAEADPIALEWLHRGYNTAILYYTCAPARFPVQLIQAAKSVALIRKHAEEFNADPDKLFAIGFSAGGHLCASLGTMWDSDIVRNGTGEEGRTVRPNAMILCYPVILSDNGNSHVNSIKNILGDEYGDREKMELVSLDRQVSGKTVPCFIWNTVTDEVVPSENTLCFANALHRNGVRFELHMYPDGIHGLVDCDNETLPPHAPKRDYPEYRGWLDRAQDFVEKYSE